MSEVTGSVLNNLISPEAVNESRSVGGLSAEDEDDAFVSSEYIF